MCHAVVAVPAAVAHNCPGIVGRHKYTDKQMQLKVNKQGSQLQPNPSMRTCQTLSHALNCTLPVGDLDASLSVPFVQQPISLMSLSVQKDSNECDVI